jgi:hypothetical protein
MPETWDTDHAWDAFAFALGQPVRLATQPSQQPGRVVGVILKEPYQALVRWKDEMTFESLDDLVEATLPPAG